MKSRLLETDDATKDRLLSLLNNDGNIPPSTFETISFKGNTYVQLSGLVNWLANMSDAAISDQKQEAYRGLREYLNLYHG